MKNFVFTSIVFILSFLYLNSQPNIPKYQNPQVHFKYTIVIGSMLKLENADKLYKLAIEKGYECFIAPVNIKKKQHYRVCVGLHQDFSEAKKQLSIIKKDFKIGNAWIWNAPQVSEVTKIENMGAEQPKEEPKEIPKAEVKPKTLKPVEQPKTEVKQETPKPVEQPKAEVKPETPKPVEQPKAEVKPETPKPVEQPKAEVKPETPKPVEQPKAEVKPKTLKPIEQPKAEVKQETPKPVEQPKAEVKQETPKPEEQPKRKTKTKKISETEQNKNLAKQTQGTNIATQSPEKEQPKEIGLPVAITDTLLVELTQVFPKFITNIRNYEYSQANKYIHPSFNFYVIYNEESQPSVREFNSFEKFFAVFSAFTSKGTSFDFSNDIDQMVKKVPQIKSYPTYDCQNKKYNQKGLVVSTATANNINLLNSVRIYYNSFNQELLPEISEKVSKVEKRIQASVIDTESSFIEGMYFGYIDGKWYLLVLDIKFRCR